MADFRYALRALRRSPTFSVVAVLTLSLGVACITTVFSVVDAVLLRGLPYRAPDHLETVFERSDDGKGRVPSYPTFRDWAAAQPSMSRAIEGFAFVRGDAVSIPKGDGEHERQITAYVTPGFFRLLGTRPLLGRTFLPDEERAGGARVAVISYDFFVSRYGGTPDVIGKTIAIDSLPTTIIGVMPRGVAYPNFGSSGYWLPPVFWQPIALVEGIPALSLRGLHVDSRALMRIAGGADSTAAIAAMRIMQQRLAEEYPVDQGHWTSIGLEGVGDELFGSLRPTLYLIAAAIVLVMLLACANVANLFLVHAGTRRREVAVRFALGATRWRIARPLLAETLIICGVASGVGAIMAVSLVAFVRRFADVRLPFASAIAVDGRSLVFTTAIAAATALLVGVIPALQAGAGSGRVVDRLRSGVTAAVGGVADQRLRQGLVALQFALAVILLIGAGLLVQSIRRLQSVPLGWDPTNVISFSVTPPKQKYGSPAQAAALYHQILDAVRTIPQVQQAAAAGGALLPTRMQAAGEAPDATPTLGLYHPVSEDYLHVMRIRMVAGRWFTADDMRNPTAFVVNERLARMLWPGSDAIGKSLTTYRASQARADFGQPITLPVMGVVADVHEFGREDPPQPELFLPYTLEVWPWMTFVVRASQAPQVVRAVKDVVRGVEPSIDFQSDPSVMDVGVPGDRRFVTSLMAGFAGGALLLAAIGLYGIVAYGVVQRTREVGIRLALGATRRSIVALILGQGAMFALAGAIVGLCGALPATRLLRHMLFETSATDGTTFVVVPLLLAAVALTASYLPARRATNIDPLIAIRSD